MTKLFFEVQAEDIERLDAIYLTRLLEKLLRCEAKSCGIAQSAVEVALNITVADGGEDGRIKWEGDPDKTDFLPKRLVQFQCKTTKKMGPTAWANEILDSKGKLKPMIKSVLENDGAYIMFTTQPLNEKQKEARVDAIRKKLRSLGEPFADDAEIHVYDASQIQGWTNKYVPAITTVLEWRHRPLPGGLMTWLEWEGYEYPKHFDYVEDAARKRYSGDLRSTLLKSGESARIIGMSGLGKTRMALELFRKTDEQDGYSDYVVYIDANNSDIAGLADSIKTWVRSDLEDLVVVDNCPLELHSRLKKEIEHRDSKLSLLTLDYNPDEDADTRTIRLESLGDEHIKKMLEQVYGKDLPDLDRIVQFAQGFPQMAVLLARARLDKAKDIGSLTDDLILKKMLGGDTERGSISRKVLEGCALFDQFGLDDTAAEEYKFIAENISKVEADDFFACVTAYKERGVIDRRGRFAQIRPKPLAIRLAADWWKKTPPERQTELIGIKMPGQLENSFCDQIAKLDFLPEVKKLAAQLCGDQGPFGQAEVILSDRGSRLFRSLVEVNPSATSDALHKVLKDLPQDKLGNIRGDTRRNIVQALEKLCFRKAVFDKSAKSLLLLSSAENESWSNNATGLFLQLFHVSLSGTEAPPEQRLRIIDDALQSPVQDIRQLAVKAMGRAIDTRGGTRVIGAEYQGSGESLQEWRPTIWQEAFDYWIESLDRLTRLALNDDDLSAAARDVIGGNIRGLLKSSDLMRKLDDSIRAIVNKRGPLWIEARENIKGALSYDSGQMPDEAKSMLNDWVDLLMPSDLKDKIHLIVSMPPFEHEKGEDSHYVDVSAEAAKKLAQELSGNISQILPCLEQLHTGEQRQTYLFAREIVSQTKGKEWKQLITESLKLLSRMENPDISFTMGMLAGISKIDAGSWQEYINQIYEDDSLSNYYVNALTTSTFDPGYLSNILELVQAGRLPDIKVRSLSYGQAISHISPDIISGFSERLSGFSQSAAWVALEVLYMYCLSEPQEKWNACESAFKKILIKLRLDNDNHVHPTETYQWQEAVIKILKKGDQHFAKAITSQILNSNLDKVEYSDRYHCVKPTIREIFSHYGNEVWSQFAQAIREADEVQAFYLAQLLSSDDGINENKPGVLSDLPDEIIMNWCREEPDKAPEFVALATEVYEKSDTVWNISNRAKFLLDEFGNNPDVLNALVSGVGSGWVGSLVPMYQMELAAIEPLLSHHHENVKKWADGEIIQLRKFIERENIRDEEQEWGIQLPRTYYQRH